MSEGAQAGADYGKTNPFPKLSSPHKALKQQYDVIVIGSGYGASIAASRCARAKQSVCVLEKGKEWRPGDFPESFPQSWNDFQVHYHGKNKILGHQTNLYEVIVSDDITVVKGCGLGGTSLINASVGLNPDPRVFQDKRWPQIIRDDMKSLLEYDCKHVHEMLRPAVYPDHYPKLKKLEAMEKIAKGIDLPDIEDFGKIFKKTPIFVNFVNPKSDEAKRRLKQPPCNGCGNCVSGCNTGAKNTLNMNYLPDAKVHGAEIFTQENTLTIKGKYVILGGGSIGSTEILLKSKEKGLELSDTLGSRFTGNGDALGFSYNGDDVVHSVGKKTGMYDKVTDDSPGPCIASVIDLRSLPGKPVEEGMVIEDGTVPGATKSILRLVLGIASEVLGEDTFPPFEELEKFFERLELKEMDKTLAFLCMSHDDASGVIRLHPNSSNAYVDWSGVGRQKIFEAISERLRQAAKQLNGEFIINPVWSKALGRQLVTVHPLGGCPMGDSGKNGVVNHKGQVFKGNTRDVLPGLYVMDGAIIPTSVGVNPIMTITMLAERCCRLMIKDNGWAINYEPADLRSLEECDLPQPHPIWRFCPFV